MNLDASVTKTCFTNPYGGFWTDLENSLEILQGKHSLGWVSDEEVELLKHWIVHGFVVIPNAVPDALVDSLLDDIDRVLHADPPICKASFWKEGTKYFEDAKKEYMKEDEAKLLDMHMVSEAARQAIFSERIHRFVTLVFERLPLAFQSLAFEYGSQQPTHCDIAFVHVTSPREFVASWIALEDIQSGSGELQYYPGSHRLDDLLFEGRSIWAEGDLSDYTRNLERKAEAAGLSTQRFTPAKGDALIWSAGLFHGGSPRTVPELTRNSLVTHYCPEDRLPHPPIGRDRIHQTDHGGSVCSYSTPLISI